MDSLSTFLEGLEKQPEPFWNEEQCRKKLTEVEKECIRDATMDRADKFFSGLLKRVAESIDNDYPDTLRWIATWNLFTRVWDEERGEWCEFWGMWMKPRKKDGDFIEL